MKISCVINADTRPERSSEEQMFKGVVDRDFLTEGIYNKVKFLEGFDKEIILFIDEHEKLDDETLAYIRKLVDVLVIRKHSKSFADIENFAAFNDFNYINALSLARGEIVFHFDQDCAAFTSSPEPINELIGLLDTYDFISYPSQWSPYPVIDDSFAGNFWVSTRFFICKRTALDFSEIIKCQLDYDYWRTKYPRTRLCHWTEHILQSIAKKGVFYPPFDENRWIVFCWQTYEKWILRRLNDMDYDYVKGFIYSHGGIHYPNNLTI